MAEALGRKRLDQGEKGAFLPLTTGARDVVDGLPDGLDLLGILVRDLDPELVLQLHDELDEIERVRVEILLERGLLRELALFDPELLDKYILHPLGDLLARSCHLDSLPAFLVSDTQRERRRMLPRLAGLFHGAAPSRTRVARRSATCSTTPPVTPRAA